MEVTYFSASAIQVITGSGSGDLADIQTYNLVTYNVTEVDSDFELIVNFTGIIKFTTLLVRHKTDVTDGHSATIQIWDYNNSRWEGYGFLSESLTSTMQTIGVYDYEKHISDGVVQVRFFQEEPPPNLAHIHEFDWVGLSRGFGTPVGQEIDPLSWHLTDFNITDYFTMAEILGFNYFNATDFSISDYVTLTNLLSFGYYNLTDFDIADYYTITEILGFNYYNLTDFDIEDYSTTAESDLLYSPINYNPFNQSLNTTDNVQFNNVTINSIIFDEDRIIIINDTCMIFKSFDTYIDLCE